MKNYCIKLGTMYLSEIRLSLEFSFNEMIEKISLTKNKFDIYFTTKENAEELSKKLYIISGIKTEIVNVLDIEELNEVYDCNEECEND